MAHKTLEEVIDKNIEIVRENLKKNGGFLPTFTLYMEDGILPVAFTFETDEEKTGALQLIQLLILKYKAYAYTIRYEGWMKRADTDEEFNKMNETGKVEGLPDAKEVVVIGYVSHDKKIMAAIDIKRDGDSVELGERTNMSEDGMGGRFLELLPPPEIINKTYTDGQKEGLKLMIELVCARYGFNMQEVNVNPEESAPHAP